MILAFILSLPKIQPCRTICTPTALLLQTFFVELVCRILHICGRKYPDFPEEHLFCSESLQHPCHPPYIEIIF